MRTTTRSCKASMLIICTVLIAGIFSACKANTAEENTTTEESTAFSVPLNLLDGIKTANSNLKTYEYAVDLTGKVKTDRQDTVSSRKLVGAMDKINWIRMQQVETSYGGTKDGRTIRGDYTKGKWLLYFVGEDMDVYAAQFSLNGQVSWQHGFSDDAERMYIAGMVDEAGLQTYLFEKCSIKSVTTEKVQGVDCYLVDLDVDLQALRDHLTWEQMDPNEMGSTNAGFSESLKRVAVRYWFARDTLLLKKGYIYLQSEIAGDRQQQYTFEMNIILSNVNQPVKIELPAEAANS